MKALFTHFALVPSLFTMIPYHVILQSSYSKWFLTIITCHNIISDSIVFICVLLKLCAPMKTFFTHLALIPSFLSMRLYHMFF